jgi:hypothetical protein
MIGHYRIPVGSRLGRRGNRVYRVPAASVLKGS